MKARATVTAGHDEIDYETMLRQTGVYKVVRGRSTSYDHNCDFDTTRIVVLDSVGGGLNYAIYVNLICDRVAIIAGDHEWNHPENRYRRSSECINITVGGL